MRSELRALLPVLLAFFLTRVEASAASPVTGCHFARNQPGSALIADPVKRSVEFAINNWSSVEIALAAGAGDALDHLRELARCDYVPPSGYWQATLKGLPYDERAKRFANDFSSQCFCAQ